MARWLPAGCKSRPEHCEQTTWNHGLLRFDSLSVDTSLNPQAMGSQLRCTVNTDFGRLRSTPTDGAKSITCYLDLLQYYLTNHFPSLMITITTLAATDTLGKLNRLSPVARASMN